METQECRPFFLVLLAAFLLAGAFAGSLRASAITDLFVQANFDSDAQVQQLPVWVPEGNYTLLASNGTEIFMLDQNATPVADHALLESILRGYIFAKSNYTASAQGAKRQIAQFNAMRQSGDLNCKRLTGIDKLPCFDHDSCLRACFAVPICTDNFQNTPGYLDEALSWNQQSSQLDLAASQFSAGIDGMNQGAGAVQGEIVLLDSINLHVAAINANKIFLAQGQGGFEFCAPINFSPDGMAALEANLTGLRDGLSQLDNASAEAASILASGQSQLDYIKNRPAKFAALKSAAEQKSKELRNNYTQLNKKINVTYLEPQVLLVENISSEISAFGANGQFAKAFGLEDTFAVSMGGAQSAMGGVQKNYSDALAYSQALSKKFDTAQSTITDNASLETILLLRANFTNEQNVLGSKMEISALDGASDGMHGINARLNDIIASQTLAGNITAPPAQEQLPPKPLLPEDIGGIPTFFYGIALGLIIVVAINVYFTQRVAKGHDEGKGNI